MPDSVQGIKDAITTWRMINKQRENASKNLEKLEKEREDLQKEMEERHAEWDVARQGALDAAARVEEEIRSSEAEVAALEEAARGLAQRTRERVARTAEHRKIVAARRAIVAEREASLRQADDVTLKKLGAFRSQRDECKAQLEQRLQQLQHMLREEQAAHIASMDRLQHRAEAARRLEHVENAEFEEQRRRRAIEIGARDSMLLQKELESAHEGSVLMGNLLRSSSKLHRTIRETLSELENSIAILSLERALPVN